MPTVYARDPISGTMVPVLGGMTRSQADARYVMSSGDVMEGVLTVPSPTAFPPNFDQSTFVNCDYVDGTNVGMIVPFTSGEIPYGWIYCNGQEVSRTTYSRLWGVISTNYGAGNGSTTFNVPNLTGRTWVGCGSDTYFDGMGEAQGQKTVTLDGSMVPYESGQFEMHNSATSTAVHGVGGSIVANVAPGAYRTGYQNPNNPSYGTATLNLGFGGGAHDNIMWSFCVHFIIKV